MSDEEEELNPNSRSTAYRQARRRGNRSLLNLLAQNIDAGQGFGGSLKEAVSETAKMNAIALKERMDPLNIASRLGGPFAAWALGKILGRTEEDVYYFSGIGRKKGSMSSKIKEDSVRGRKIGNLDTSLYTSVSENQQRRFKKGDGTADLLSRMLNLMKKYHDEDVIYQELQHQREKEHDEKRERFNKKLSSMIKGVVGSSPTSGPGGPGSEGESGGSGILGNFVKAFLIGKTGRFILSRVLKSQLGKFLVKTKIGRFLIKNSLRVLRPFKGSPLNVAKNLVTAPFKAITKFLTPSAKVAETAVKGASTASKVSAAAAKPGFLKTAEEKIAERSARIAAEKTAENTLKETAKSAASTTGKAVKGIEKAGTAAEKIVGKKIPVLGAIVGTGFAVERAMAGDYLGAGGEFLSGLLSTVPGLGTAASLAIDGALLARDLSKDDEKPTATPAPGATATPPTPAASQSGTSTSVPSSTAPGSPGTSNAPMSTTPSVPTSGPQGEAVVKDTKGRLGYMKRTGRSMIFVPFDQMPEQKAKLAPPQADQNSVRLQSAIKQNEDTKIQQTGSPLKPVVVEANKTINTGTNLPDNIDYGSDFNVRETDPTLFWVTRTNMRPI